MLSIGDGLFLFLTRPLGADLIERLDLFEVTETLDARGWRIRVAGPRWFLVWHRDLERLTRLRVLLLPEAWSGLSDREVAGVLAHQIDALGLGRFDRAALALPRAALWAKLAQASRNG